MGQSGGELDGTGCDPIQHESNETILYVLVMVHSIFMLIYFADPMLHTTDPQYCSIHRAS